MKLLETEIKDFGKLHQKKYTFGPRINLIGGLNESGKSTFHTFLRSMLFDMERGRGRASKNDIYSRYLPWDRPGNYGGSLDFTSGGHTYHIERCFLAGARSSSLYDVTTNRAIGDIPAALPPLIGGLRESSYNNTVSIAHSRAATDGSLINDLKNYIGNLTAAGSGDINLSGAVNDLKKEHKALEKKLLPFQDSEYHALKSHIADLEEELDTRSCTGSLEALAAARDSAKQELSARTSRRETLNRLILQARNALAGSGFQNAEEASAMDNRLTNAYSTYIRYNRGKPMCQSKGLVFLFNLLAFVLLFATLYFFHLGSRAFLTKNYLSSLSFILPYLISLLAAMHLRTRAVKSRIGIAAAQFLSSYFDAVLSDRAITSENCDRAHKKVVDYLTLKEKADQCAAEAEHELQKIFQLQESLNEVSARIESQQRVDWELDHKQEELQKDRILLQEMEQKRDHNQKIREEIDALDLALYVMDNISSTIQKTFDHYLNRTASKILESLTDGAYSDMRVDENLSITVVSDYRDIPLESLSTGTVDQVYLAFRLAVIRLFWPSEPMPLILDDAFASYDDKRLTGTLSWLHSNYRGQVLVFTCHSREKLLLKASGVPFTEICI